MAEINIILKYLKNVVVIWLYFLLFFSLLWFNLIGRTDAEAETPILWPPDAKKWLIGKDPDAGKDWRQEEKGMTGWDGWMASLTQWTWVWAGSGSWWWTGKPGVLQSMGSKSWTQLSNWIVTLMAPVKTRLIMVDGGGLFDNPAWPLALGISSLFFKYFYLFMTAGSGCAVAAWSFL